MKKYLKSFMELFFPPEEGKESDFSTGDVLIFVGFLVLIILIAIFL